MSGYLLDTNVVSESTKLSPRPSVISFLNTRSDLWISVIVVEELELGIRLLPEGRRKDELRNWLFQLLADFDGHLLPIQRGEAEWAAVFQARAHRDGRRLQLGDALIAGTAMANDLTIATRNVSDFDYLGVGVANPWDAP